MRFFLVLVVLFFTTETYSKSGTMVASWYQQGKRTASGEIFKPSKLTAAHRTLPFGTKLKLTYRKKSIIVRINDRGPHIRGRHIDLSRGAARRLGCIRRGKCRVKYKIIRR